MVAAKYLGGRIITGPAIMYDIRFEIDELIDLLSVFVKFSVERSKGVG